MQERVRELENAYKKYLFKKRLKYLLFMVFLSLFVCAIFIAMQSYYQKKLIYLEALEHKKKLEQNIVQAKISQEKAKITKEKLIQEIKDLKEFKENFTTKIEINSKIFNIEKLKNNFYQNPSYEKALLLADEYYKKKNYNKSIFWALKANDINKEAKDSWFMFAKAQIALGNKNEAKKALDIYLDSYGFIELDKELEND
ncbi:CDC27 family protein [Campylobacter aviculae]|uniref:Transformation system protein n=1 Tax=Campylobacter aviculae TaxID=2510190 RepID=A0A4U7BMQ3_9BACT|nr:transformation system protein [Campylobacter aviculae]